MQVAEKLSSLRSEMQAEGIDALIVGNSDPHNNELCAERWRCREWLAHMKGSSGTVVVTADWAGLWTDSRYYDAAEIALEGTEIELMRMSNVGCPSIEAWLKTNFEAGSCIAFDGQVVPLAQGRSWQSAFENVGLRVVTHLDLLERVWLDRPAPPKGKLFWVPVKYMGESREDKIARVREKLAAMKVDVHLLGRTDETCWLFNFRGTDIPDLPTPYCYTLISQESVEFFIDPAKLDDEARAFLAEAGVTLRPYGEIFEALEALPVSTRFLKVPAYTNLALAKASEHCVQVEGRAVVTDLKGVKNATEVAHLKQALIDDGAAMVKFYHWLYQCLERGEKVSELSASHKLTACRAEVDGFRHPSFESIMGYAHHGALAHYSVDEESDLELKQENIFLIDSGGNYLHGTTDTTRVIPLGDPTQQQKDDYTLVLRAMIDLMSVEFAEGTTGAQLDGICRQALWKSGRQFLHGTGHGVGFGLEVHEGPQNLSGRGTEIFHLGQITTIEPGCYRSGSHGIRIENMVHTVLSQETEFGRFFKFENLTFCPINVDLVEPDLLMPEHVAWLNDYNAQVLEKLSPLLSEDEQAWLAHECRAIA